MKKYDSYKNSGIEWLGEIPSHWMSSNLKRICSKITDGAHTSPDLSSSDFPFLSVVNLKNGKLDFDNCHYTSSQDYQYLVRNNCKPNANDVLFSKDGTIGETILITDDIDFVVGSSFIIARSISKVILPEFLYYFLKSVFILDSTKSSLKGTGIPRLSIFNFGRLEILIPSIKEQIAVAKYLDYRTKAIDKKINILEQKITHHKDLRKSLINQLISKGLNKNVKLKDSGIDWIGKIPEHWEVKRIKDIFSSLAGGTPSTKEKEYWIGDIPWIPSGKVQNDIIVPDVVEEYISDKALKESSTKTAKANSILIALTGATCSNIGYLTFDTTINQSIVALFPKRNLNTKFYFNFLISGREKIRTYMTGGAQGGINQEDVKFLRVLLPPEQEQTEIAVYLDLKTKTIDKIIGNIETQINTLKELRKTLINDVVTGKIKVV